MDRKHELDPSNVPDNTAIFTNNGAPVSLTVSAPHRSIQSRSTPERRRASVLPITSFIHNNSFSILVFNNSSTAGNATIINDGSLRFVAGSTAGNANITNDSGAFVNMTFFDTATAGNATITNNGPLNFLGASTAGNATITSKRGCLIFNNTSTAGNAAITNNWKLQAF